MRQTDVQFHPYPNDCGYQPCWRQLISNISIIPCRKISRLDHNEHSVLWIQTSHKGHERNCCRWTWFKPSITVLRVAIVQWFWVEPHISCMSLGDVHLHLPRGRRSAYLRAQPAPSHSRCPSFFFLGHLWVQLLRHPLYTIWWQPMQRCTGQCTHGQAGPQQKALNGQSRPTFERGFPELPRTQESRSTDLPLGMVNW